MKRRNFVGFGISAIAVSACTRTKVPVQRAKFKRYTGRKITGVIVEKNNRIMKLLHHGKVLRTYEIDLGFAPSGHKKFEGDGRTPEGLYRINRENPNSRFHLSLGISYPNARDVAVAKAAGKSPGGEIFIHGGPTLKALFKKPDWTEGCISVTNAEMEDIYAMIEMGTPISIKP